MQKIKKHYYGFISTQNEVGQAEIERKKIHRYDPFILDPEQGFPKKLQKKLKKLENINMASSQAKTGTGEAENMEKKKILVLIHSNPTWNREFQKDSKKIKKIKKTSLRLLFKPKWDGRG